jgi:hypothetical protein
MGDSAQVIYVGGTKHGTPVDLTAIEGDRVTVDCGEYSEHYERRRFSLGRDSWTVFQLAAITVKP